MTKPYIGASGDNSRSATTITTTNFTIINVKKDVYIHGDLGKAKAQTNIPL